MKQPQSLNRRHSDGKPIATRTVARVSLFRTGRYVAPCRYVIAGREYIHGPEGVLRRATPRKRVTHGSKRAGK